MPDCDTTSGPIEPPDPIDLVASLAARGIGLVVVAAGGGARALARLVTTPGSTGTLLEGLVPSARAAVDRLLGGRQETYCSSRAARRLAVVAWQRAIDDGATPDKAFGVAVVASLKTVAAKRGPHRVIVATHALSATSVATLELAKDARSRDGEEDIAAALALEEIARHAPGGGVATGAVPLLAGERVDRELVAAGAAWQALLAGSSRVTGIGVASPDAPADRLLFPGSFDPLHEGHLAMAGIAERIAGRPVDFELSVANVDKPPLDYLEIRSRVDQFAGRPLWLTRAATFLEKLAVFPRGTFVLGADTFVRLADPRYYGGSAAAAADAVRSIASQARGLIVFGRTRDGMFLDAAALDVPQPLRDISTFVPEREFRADISSTALRRERLPCDAS